MGYGRDRRAALADRDLVQAALAAGHPVTVCRPGAKALGLNSLQWERVVRAEDEPGCVTDVAGPAEDDSGAPEMLPLTAAVEMAAA